MRGKLKEQDSTSVGNKNREWIRARTELRCLRSVI